jgi:starch synthase
MTKSFFMQPVAQRVMQLSANATVDAGGQGRNLQHVIAGLAPAFALRVFCRGGSAEVPVHTVAESRRASLIGAIPYLRRLRDWRVYFSDSDFDAYVAARLMPCDLVQGVTGQCLETLAAARRQGSRTVLDVLTVHVDDFVAAQRKECPAFGVRPVTHEKMRQRILQEYDAADLIRVQSSLARESFLRRGFSGDRLVAAPAPMDTEEFPQAAFAGEKFRVSYVGLLEPWKGFHYLIEAFRAANLADSELVLWGAPGSRGVSRYLARQLSAEPRIDARSFAAGKAGYAAAYGDSSVLVHPSLSDGFAYAVVEAMASGLPVIVTSATGASEWVKDGVSGFVVPPGDTGAIAERLKYLHGNPARVREMGSAAREAVKQLTVERFHDVFVRRVQAL